MTSSQRIIVNTIAQYSRALISALLSLYSTRLILQVLGMSDYGIYTLIAGVVALLGFITNALVITTQRYLSYHTGKGEDDYVRRIFANSLLLHILFALAIGLVLLSFMPMLFNGILNIEPHRVDVAKQIYLLAIAMLQISILIAPFKACFIAHENIIYISIVEITDAFLRVGLAVGLTYVTMDTLLFYGASMAGISMLNLLAFALYAAFRYHECHILGIWRERDRNILHKLTGFAGWTAYGMGCIVGRNQGLAVILNNFWGTAINASFGIGMQVYGSIAFISTSVVNAFNPQIMKAEGAGDRQRMLHLAEQESKYSEMLLMLLLIPILFEMPSILQFWLGVESHDTIMFCRLILISLMCDQLTYGLNGVNQALGKVRQYCLIMYTPKLIILPMAAVMIKMGLSVQWVMIAYVGIELIMALVRLPYMHKVARLDIAHFITSVFLPLMPLLIAQVLIGWLLTHYIQLPYRFLLTFALSVVVGIIVTFAVVLSGSERQKVVSLVRTKIKR